jgi:hypothetical protein
MRANVCRRTEVAEVIERIILKMYLKEMSHDDAKWIQLAHDRIQE